MNERFITTVLEQGLAECVCYMGIYSNNQNDGRSVTDPHVYIQGLLYIKNIRNHDEIDVEQVFISRLQRVVITQNTQLISYHIYTYIHQDLLFNDLRIYIYIYIYIYYV